MSTANRPSKTLDDAPHRSRQLGYRHALAYATIITPLFILLGIAVAPLLLTDTQWARVIDSEQGVLEWMTVLMLLPAVVACAWIAATGRSWPQIARVWFGVLAFGLFYFAGEEASWGQHALGFTPPAAIAESNLQGEFNLHNADAWYHDLLNEIPRSLAAIFCAGVCGILPWWNKPASSIESPTPPSAVHSHAHPSWWRWLVPGKALVVAGISVALISVIDGPFEGTAWDQPGRWLYYALTEIDDELTETLMAVTLFFYSFDRLVAVRRDGRASMRR